MRFDLLGATDLAVFPISMRLSSVGKASLDGVCSAEAVSVRDGSPSTGVIHQKLGCLPL